MADDNLSAHDRGKGQAGGGASGPSPASFAGAGIQFVLSILIFLYAGKWLDTKLGTAPWLLMAGVFLGAGASFYSFYRRVMAASRKNGDT
jgi:F0F1-type ATP synthase assembly protein I